jgi:hypothetical protein
MQQQLRTDHRTAAVTVSGDAGIEHLTLCDPECRDTFLTDAGMPQRKAGNRNRFPASGSAQHRIHGHEVSISWKRRGLSGKLCDQCGDKWMSRADGSSPVDVDDDSSDPWGAESRRHAAELRRALSKPCISLGSVDLHSCQSTPVVRALEAGTDHIETSPRGRHSQLTKPIRKITPDEAATLVDYHDRKWFRFADNVDPVVADTELSQYDDLLMRASNPEFFPDEPDELDAIRNQKRKSAGKSLQLVCQGPGCGKRFTAFRRSAKYHSDGCAKRAYRDRRMSRLSDAKTDPSMRYRGCPKSQIQPSKHGGSRGS